VSEIDKVLLAQSQKTDPYLVPLIFEGFANDLAQRVASLSPITVLETAAGSGVVTRALTSRL
jgi:hypothetical protein